MRKRKQAGPLIAAGVALFAVAAIGAFVLVGCDRDDPAPTTVTDGGPTNPAGRASGAPAPATTPTTHAGGGNNTSIYEKFVDVTGPVKPDRVIAKVIQTLPIFNRPASSAVSADRKFLFVTNSGAVLRDAQSYRYYTGAISKLEIQPDGRLTMLKQNFVESLHAPMGIEVLPKATRKFPAGSLFVCMGATSGYDDKDDPVTDITKFNPGVGVFSPDTGKMLGFIPMGPGRAVAKSLSPPRPVLAPTGICFDKNANLYVTDCANTGRDLVPRVIGYPGIVRIPFASIDAYADNQVPPGTRSTVTFMNERHEPTGVFYSRLDDGIYWATSDGKGPAGGGIFRVTPEDFGTTVGENVLGGEGGSSAVGVTPVSSVSPMMGLTITPQGKLIASRLDGDLVLTSARVLDRVRFAEDASFSSPAEIKLLTLPSGYSVLYVPEEEANAVEPWRQRLRVVLLPTSY